MLSMLQRKQPLSQLKRFQTIFLVLKLTLGLQLNQKAQEEIKNYLMTRFKLKDLLAVTMTDTNRALFTTQKNPNRGFTPSTLAQHFHYMYKGAGISGAASHSSRRTFITKLSEMGVSVRVLMDLAGHRSLAVTQKYIESNPKLMRSAVELLS